MNRSKIAPLVFLILISMQANADDAPKRKSGLWEIKMQMDGKNPGMPGGGPIQMCVDQAIDNVTRDQSKEKADCPVMDVKRSVGKVTMHSVCKVDGSMATTDAVITGDFDKQYRNDMTVTYNPPKNGVSTAKMTQEARWLGPCKPGQKPGDMMMPGMPAINPNNMQEMMKDPQFREMMKRQQQAR